MKKRLGLVAIGMGLLLALGGCGNNTVFGKFQYNYAQFKAPNGDIIQGEIKSWSNQHDTVIELVMKDGSYYLVDSKNVVLSFDQLKEDDQ